MLHLFTFFAIIVEFVFGGMEWAGFHFAGALVVSKYY